LLGRDKEMSTKVKNKAVVCPVCKEEIEVRSAFAYMTLSNHMKTHKKEGEDA